MLESIDRKERRVKVKYSLKEKIIGILITLFVIVLFVSEKILR